MSAEKSTLREWRKERDRYWLILDWWEDCEEDEEDRASAQSRKKSWEVERGEAPNERVFVDRTA